MISFNQNTEYDVICLGRSTVDIYSLDIGALENAVKFAKYLGGSPANTAVALSKLNLKVGFIGKVSDDGMGRFVKQYLDKQGIDVSHILTDKEGHKTAITIGEILEGGQCSCLMYRDNCADLYLNQSEIDAEYIRKSKALLVSGTSLSYSPAREAVIKAVGIAQDAGVKVIFDPDFREGTWSSKDIAGVYLLDQAVKSDIVISTKEEMAIIFKALFHNEPYCNEKIACYLLEKGCSLVNIKDGKSGSTVYSKEETVKSPSYHIDGVVKTFGAGDSYAAGFISALLMGKDLKFAQAQGAGAAAITIKGHSCSDASPSRDELNEFMATHELAWNR